MQQAVMQPSGMELQAQTGMNQPPTPTSIRNSYAKSFYDMEDGTPYVVADLSQRSIGAAQPANDGYTIDSRGALNVFTQQFQAEKKALTTTSGGPGTAGQAIVGVYLTPELIDETRKQTPIVEMIGRYTNQGITAEWNNITVKGLAYTRAEGVSSLPVATDTYDRYSVPIKFLYTVGQVEGPAQAAIPPGVFEQFQPAPGAVVGPFSSEGAPTAMQREVLTHARALRELEEKLIINGNATTSTQTGNPNGTEFDGIVTIMGSTNTVDKNSSPLVLTDINAACKNAFKEGGSPDLCIASASVVQKLSDLINAKTPFIQPAGGLTAGNVGRAMVAWGHEVITLQTPFTRGPIPVIPSRFMNDTSGSRAMYFLQMSVVEMRVLQDMTYEVLAQNADHRRFMMKIYECLIIRNKKFCSSITEIAD